MRQRLFALCAVAAGSYMLIGCAVSPEEDPVYIRMNDLDSRVQRIERVVTNQSLIELAQRIDALQAELRAMRGEVEVLQHQNEGGKSQTRTLYGDLEKRIAALETLGGVAGSGAAGSLAPPAGGTAAAGGEQASYDAAFNALKSSDYPRAIAGFKNFVSTYPASPLASNAQYWLGEAYYVNREFPNALGAFQRVISEWPDSRKAPDALVKVGFTQAALGKTAEARDALENVQKRYPGSEAAALATERLKRLSNGK